MEMQEQIQVGGSPGSWTRVSLCAAPVNFTDVLLGDVKLTSRISDKTTHDNFALARKKCSFLHFELVVKTMTQRSFSEPRVRLLFILPQQLGADVTNGTQEEKEHWMKHESHNLKEQWVFAVPWDTQKENDPLESLDYSPQSHPQPLLVERQQRNVSKWSRPHHLPFRS